MAAVTSGLKPSSMCIVDRSKVVFLLQFIGTQESKQEFIKLVSLVKNGGKSTKWLHSLSMFQRRQHVALVQTAVQCAYKNIARLVVLMPLADKSGIYLLHIPATCAECNKSSGYPS